MQADYESLLRIGGALRDRPLDVAFLGHVYTPTGYGTAARSYIHALHRSNVNLSIYDCDRQKKRMVLDPLVCSLEDREIAPELYIGHSEPTNVMPMESVFRRLIVLTTWETESLPQRAVEGLNQVLEVWVPSSFNREVFQRQLQTPVFQLPHPVSLAPSSCMDRAEIESVLGVKEDDYVFLAVATWQERKNLPGLIESFTRAFSGDPKFKLVIKTSFHFTDAQLAVRETVAAIRRVKTLLPVVEQIKVFANRWPDEAMAGLMQRADCYVSLHSGEGWCYPLFDAACNGTPVIATGYSGPLDYLDPRYHRLVRYEMAQCDTRQQPSYFTFTPDMMWARPDLSHATELMREVYEHREAAIEQAKAGAVLLKEKYSIDAVGKMAKERLTFLADKLRVHSGS
jgi:glycosyltransferase involved in cell wall biosynthesis